MKTIKSILAISIFVHTALWNGWVGMLLVGLYLIFEGIVEEDEEEEDEG